MLRDKNLVPLSHQHQHALALCVRLDRALEAGEVEAAAWQAEIQDAFEHEVCHHFAAEEKELFPIAARFPELTPLIDELRAEHVVLRGLFAQAEARSLDAAGLEQFVENLARHIRKEERLLFEQMQSLMSSEELTALGASLEKALAEAPKSCSLRKASDSQQKKS